MENAFCQRTASSVMPLGIKKYSAELEIVDDRLGSLRGSVRVVAECQRIAFDRSLDVRLRDVWNTYQIIHELYSKSLSTCCNFLASAVLPRSSTRASKSMVTGSSENASSARLTGCAANAASSAGRRLKGHLHQVSR
jgi:hypothetical protein